MHRHDRRSTTEKKMERENATSKSPEKFETSR